MATDLEKKTLITRWLETISVSDHNPRPPLRQPMSMQIAIAISGRENSSVLLPQKTTPPWKPSVPAAWAWSNHEQHSLDRTVAIKTLHKEFIGREHVEQSFLIEAEVLAELEHPNIVPIIDSGRNENGAPYYVMKRVAGKAWSAFFSGETIDLEHEKDAGKVTPGDDRAPRQPQLFHP